MFDITEWNHLFLVQVKFSEKTVISNLVLYIFKYFYLLK